MEVWTTAILEKPVTQRIILASTSKYRKALLKRVGIEAECMRPTYEENPIEGLTPKELVEAHGKGKALSVVDACDPAMNAVVIGSDQGLVFENALVGKPGTAERAVEQLLRFGGKSCELVTSLYVYSLAQKRAWTHVDVTVLTFARLDASVIRHYVAWDNPIDCAGSFKIESRGPELFESIETKDPTAIEGLPLMALCRILREIP